MTGKYILTVFQAEEVQGLLTVREDEVSMGNDELPVWGRIEWVGKATLVVTNPEEAIDDLEYRAKFLIEEGIVAGKSGVSGARSLRYLADAIRKGSSYEPL